MIGDRDRLNGCGTVQPLTAERKGGWGDCHWYREVRGHRHWSGHSQRLRTRQPGQPAGEAREGIARQRRRF